MVYDKEEQPQSWPVLLSVELLRSSFVLLSREILEIFSTNERHDGRCAEIAEIPCLKPPSNMIHTTPTTAGLHVYPRPCDHLLTLLSSLKFSMDDESVMRL